MKDRRKEYHKDKVQNEITSKMKTMMIGALSSIEEHFGELWALGKNRPLTDTEQRFYDAFMLLRKEILDRGNTQIKSAKMLLDPYDIDYVGYTLELRLPVVRRDNENT